jgi:hypothetical protein
MTLIIVAALLTALTYAKGDTLPVFVTKGPVPACRTTDDLYLFNTATQIDDMSRIRELIASNTCVVWPKGTSLYLDKSVEGGFSSGERLGIKGNVMRVYTEKDPHIYFITPFPELQRELYDTDKRRNPSP